MTPIAETLAKIASQEKKPSTDHALVLLAEAWSQGESFSPEDLAHALSVQPQYALQKIQDLALSGSVELVPGASPNVPMAKTLWQFVPDNEDETAFVAKNGPGTTAFPSLPETPSCGVSGTNAYNGTVYYGRRTHRERT